VILKKFAIDGNSSISGYENDIIGHRTENHDKTGVSLIQSKPKYLEKVNIIGRRNDKRR